ncbi:MAG: OmpA family protein [Crocinitomicaceae bacterium]|jgi:chemotaxis protein MotB|nr:OmpA family protein [Crocinitomicaceae bacterium]
MKHFFSFLILAFGAVITACAPVYQCGNKPEKELLGSKRLKATVVQRDSLCNALDEQKSINAELNQDINELQEELAAETASKKKIMNEYDQFIDQSSGEQAKLMKSLKQKEDELKDREKALNDMKAILARQDSITNRLNNILRNALLGFNSDELSVEIKNGKVYVSMSDKLLFKSGSADMEQKGQEALKALAGVLTKNPDIDVLVEGHTDSLPIKTALYKDNWDLSVARAASVVRLLTDTYSVNPKQVTPAGRGEFFPKADNSTPEGRAKNRRTEIILSPKLDEVMNLLNK